MSACKDLSLASSCEFTQRSRTAAHDSATAGQFVPYGDPLRRRESPKQISWLIAKFVGDDGVEYEIRFVGSICSSWITHCLRSFCRAVQSNERLNQPAAAARVF